MPCSDFYLKENMCDEELVLLLDRSLDNRINDLIDKVSRRPKEDWNNDCQRIMDWAVSERQLVGSR